MAGEYEIDLCAKHSQKFDDVVGRYAERARRASARLGDQAPDDRSPAAQRRHPQLGQANRD